MLCNNLCITQSDFQQLDMDYTVGDPMPGMPGSKVGPVPIIRMFGVTQEGYSVTANVHGIAPYFFVPAPQGFSQGDCERFRAALNVRTLHFFLLFKSTIYLYLFFFLSIFIEIYGSSMWV